MGAVRHLELVPREQGAPQARPRHLSVVPAHRRRRRPAAVYRRRRLVVVLVVVPVVVLGVAALRPSQTGEGPTVTVRPAGPSVHVVQPGDSYWSIATSLRPGGDVRETVDALVDANGSRVLQVGDRVLLPG